MNTKIDTSKITKCPPDPRIAEYYSSGCHIKFTADSMEMFLANPGNDAREANNQIYSQKTAPIRFNWRRA